VKLYLIIPCLDMIGTAAKSGCILKCLCKFIMDNTSDLSIYTLL
jgi:hypothetical protein